MELLGFSFFSNSKTVVDNVMHFCSLLKILSIGQWFALLHHSHICGLSLSHFIRDYHQKLLLQIKCLYPLLYIDEYPFFSLIKWISTEGNTMSFGEWTCNRRRQSFSHELFVSLLSLNFAFYLPWSIFLSKLAVQHHHSFPAPKSTIFLNAIVVLTKISEVKIAPKCNEAWSQISENMFLHSGGSHDRIRQVNQIMGLVI